MDMKIGLHLKQRQQLVMTPQLQQAIRLLQLSRMELVDAINSITIIEKGTQITTWPTPMVNSPKK